MRRLPQVLKVSWLLITAVACTPEPEEGVLVGPGFDETGAFIGLADTDDDQEYVVGYTYLRVKNAPGPGGTFGDHAQAIGEYVQGPNPPDGMVGAAFRNVGRLQWWTLTVWEDEDAMMDFVLSEPHASAMLDFFDITAAARSGHATVGVDDLPVDFTWSMDRLEEERWIVGGDDR